MLGKAEGFQEAWLPENWGLPARQSGKLLRLRGWPDQFSFKTNMSHLGAGNRAEGFYWVEITSDKMQNNVYCLATAFALPRILARQK